MLPLKSNSLKQKVAMYVMCSRGTKFKRTLLESGPGFLTKEHEKNPSYGHTCAREHGALKASTGNTSRNKV